MNQSTPRSKAVRSRATQRLRTLTIGTTLAGLTASAGFGWLAAATYDGTGATPTGSATTTADDALNAPAATSGTDGSSGSSGSTSGRSSTSSSSGSSSSTGVTRSSGRAHVSTGGS